MLDISRNIGILTEGEQEKIARSPIAILGLGLGSIVAELAVRMGFSNIYIADGDTVSMTNLNRQIFVASDINKEKTAAVERKLKNINPQVNLIINDQFLHPDHMPVELDGMNVIIDTIDLSSFEVINALHEWARQNKKPIVFPINLGWKSMITVFTDKSATINDLLCFDDKEEKNIRKGDFEAWALFLSKHVPRYGQERFAEFIARASSMNDWCPAPQVGPTAFTTASLCIMTTIHLLLGHKTIVAPDIASIDSYSVTSANE